MNVASPHLLLATPAMGTRFELVLVGDDGPSLRASGEEALREIELWHQRLSRFLPHSDIARLNRDPSARTDPETRALLDLCGQVREDSGGAFDIRVGRLMERHGLHPASGDIDLGAIGKGFALDRAAAILRDCGVTRALLHGGTSSVVAIGDWPVAVRSDGEPLRVCLSDQSLAVSAPRGLTVASASLPMSAASAERTNRDFCPPAEPSDMGKDADAAAITHILDPRSGLPALAADTAAVIGDSAALCDAWSTALIVLGHRPARFPAAYESHIHTPTHGWLSRHAELQAA